MLRPVSRRDGIDAFNPDRLADSKPEFSGGGQIDHTDIGPGVQQHVEGFARFPNSDF